MLYRNYDPDFQSVFSNAIAEGSSNTNEKGLLTGLNIKFNRIAFIFFIFFVITLIYSIHLLHLGFRKINTDIDFKQKIEKMKNILQNK